MEEMFLRDQPGEDAFDSVASRGAYYEFVRLVQLLEQHFPNAESPGESFHLAREKIRFRPFALPSFSAGDVRSVSWDRRGAGNVEVVMGYPGLYGVKAPLPDHLHAITQLIEGDARPGIDEEQDLDRKAAWATRDFFDIFNHRYYSFLYRALTKYRPELANRKRKRDGHFSVFFSLSGYSSVPTGEVADNTSVQDVLQFVRFLAGTQRNAEGLRRMIEQVISGIKVEIEQFVPRWVKIRSRPVLGRTKNNQNALGKNTFLGGKMYDVSSKIRIWLGPLDSATYDTLLPGGEAAHQLARVIKLYLPCHLEYDVGLLLETEKMSRAQLGMPGRRLGRNIVLGQPRKSIVPRVVAYQ